LCLKQGIVV